VLNKARFEELAQSGGKQAVRKAIEKRKLKLTQKEKRSRPDGGAPQSRHGIGSSKSRSDGVSSRKRIKFS
jgi:ribosomal RNA-processing protein 36